MVQLSSVSNHEVRAAQGWDGEVQTASKKETKQRHTDLGLPQGKLRSNLHEVTERERTIVAIIINYTQNYLLHSAALLSAMCYKDVRNNNSKTLNNLPALAAAQQRLSTVFI